MERFVREPRLLITAAGLLLVAGLSALATIVRQEDPTITNGVALIITPFPGATAERVESLVTEKLEEELQQIQEVETLESTSRAGISVISVQLDQTLIGDATAPVFSKVRDALADAEKRLPSGALSPIFDDERFGAYTSILGLAWAGKGPAPHIILQRYASELEDALRGVPGTDHVKVFGRAEERIEVRFDPQRLAAAGLGPAGIAEALRRADAKVAAGALRVSGHDVLLEISGELDGLDRVREVPLARSPDGVTLRLRDVATVERMLASPPREMARVDGSAGVVIAAQLAAGQRFDVWSSRLKPKVEAFRARLPEGMVLQTVFDQTIYTKARLSELLSNLLVGLSLVVVVLFVTLGWRAALVVTTALPLVTLSAVAVLRFMDVPIHQMSVTGLIVALGLLVDNAIVVTDAIRSRRLEGMSSLDAVRTSTHHLRVPLFASTLTTVLAFMPILILPGRTGEFVGTIALSVIVSLVASYVIAMTLVAGFAGRFLPAGANGADGFWTNGLRVPRLTAAFAKSLDWSLQHPKLSMLVASFLPVLGFLGASQLPKQFFPPADRDHFHLEVHMPASSSIRATETATRRIETILRAQEGVTEVHWFVGRSAPPFYYNMIQNQDGNPAFAQALVGVRSVEDVAASFPELQSKINTQVPGAQVILRELLQGPPVNAPVEYRIYGPEIETLRTLGETLRERMSRVGAITQTTASLTASSPKLRLHLDEVEALGAGLRPVDVARQLQVTLEGMNGGSVIEGSEELPVRVRAYDSTRARLAGLGEVPLLSRSSPTGVPLSAVTHARLVPVLDGIPRRNGERVNVVRGFASAGVFPETALQGLREILAADPIEVPPGYRLEIGGDAEKRGDAMGDLFASVPVLVLLMIASVALSLNSYRLAAIIFGTAFQAMGFGLLSLSILGFPLGFQAIIGVIGLVGVAINAGIVISSALQADPMALRGDSVRMRDIVLGETSRHIISTTITTFGGFLPLILSAGGFWPPFASVIAGGVLLSTIGSFYFVPAAFALFTRRRPLVPSEASS